MKNQNIKGISLVLAAAVAISGCKSTDWSKVKYEVTPDPLELKGDSVAVTVKVTVPEKVFQPKNTVVFTPAIKWNGGEKTLKPVTFQGEKIKEGNGIKVEKAKGTSYTYTDKVAYQPEMKVSELKGKATITKKKKSKDYDFPKLADATIVTPLLVMNDDKAIMGKDQMPKVVPMNQDADIHFVVSQSNIRSTETGKDDVKDALKFIKGSKVAAQKDKKGTETAPEKVNYELKGVSISAYASPDGEQDMNADLAKDRADATAKYLMAEFKKAKMEAGAQESFYSKTSVAEDWEGFKALMEKSTVPDKEMILRILTTYSDLDKREQEIKNIAKAYTEISDQILPDLRRSKISVKAEKLAKTDDVLKTMSTSQADSLTVEELLYSANLYQGDMNTQMNIYNNVVRIYPNDWRGPNNIGGIYLAQNKLNDAEAQFQKADKLSANNPVVQNNLGVVARWKGDRKAAATYYANAGSAGPEVGYNKGILAILDGNYSEAVSNFGSENTFNAALAKLLAGNYDAAASTIDASKDKDSAMGYYLKAIVGARKKDTAMMNNNLKSAIAKDASLKSMAKDDREFVKFADNADYKAIVQ
jgi:Flp pilus assembly protein TadD